MTDYKRLCAELVDAIDSGIPTDRMHLSPLMLRVRDALAEPEPEEPKDSDLHALAFCFAQPCFDFDYIPFARAVLARWGNHPGSPDSSTLQPIPVSERLPGPEDCDAKGRCWAWKLDDEEDAWHLELKEWINSPWTTHWLPANALPQPS